ncbi:uncharacterized protein LOC124812420 [Hydra vulgaris]|uniref:uncharacterized protein LOC124812420 n=1 Tax=Hydra vulgaris TaxID=6087 RepID=UPI001F5FF16D|nr:uncharacterized protein LOC124812420 [Hydra vulgaris]
MIKKFFSIEVNQKGELLSKEERENHKLFLGGEIGLGDADGTTILFNELKIAQHPSFIQGLLGQFPVVTVNFKNTKGNSYNEVLSLVKSALHETFLEHVYLIASSKLREDEIKLFIKYIDNLDHQNLTYTEVCKGLFTLSRLLFKHFGKHCFILMDEYDSAINHSSINFCSKESIKVIELFMIINEATFKSNRYLKKGLITGVFRQANLISLLNLTKYSILDDKFFHHYGFTEHEIKYLFDQYNVPESLGQEMKDWYNGYTLKGVELYNPWSIVNCLTKFKEYSEDQNYCQIKMKILQSYWNKSKNIDFLKDLFDLPSIKNKIDLLLKDEPFYFDLQNYFSNTDLMVIKEVISLGSNYAINESTTDILFSFLFHVGYLTFSEKNGFKLPNKELKFEFQNMLRIYYNQQYNIDSKLFLDISDQLQKNLECLHNSTKLDQASESLKISFINLLKKFPKFEKIGNEELIPSVMTYITLQLKSLSKFSAEVYFGNGRADIMLIDELNKNGLVMEINYIKDATEAVEQIKTKQYAKRLIDKLDIIIICLNVSDDKEVDIKCYKIITGSY